MNPREEEKNFPRLGPYTQFLLTHMTCQFIAPLLSTFPQIKIDQMFTDQGIFHSNLLCELCQCWTFKATWVKWDRFKFPSSGLEKCILQGDWFREKD